MLWQKSAQYQNMPHQQYMQTDEGKRANQAFANWNTQMQGRPSASGFGGQPATPQRPVFSKGNSYSPGKAQPMQTPPAGTLFLGQFKGPTPERALQMKQNLDALGAQIMSKVSADPGQQQAVPTSPQQVPREALALAQGAPLGGTYFDDMVPIGSGGSGTASDPRFTQQFSGAGNLAYAPPGQRPPPFQAAYGQIGGGYAPQQNAGQRDAFISNINNKLGQMQQQSWASPGSVGAPQFNFGQMWGQAGDMVQQGWQSPLAGLFGSQGNAQPSGRLNSQFTGPRPPQPPGGWFY